ncbi:MAG TPA: DUF2723 domain-containing protein [Burkholderiales bacterium]|nr:DUF2723 domain-containing protein [Burkholderiales bacterium]
MTPAQFTPQRRDWATAGALAAALFVLYAASAPRGVALEDDGLFVLSSYFLGIEHPPGYPLHTLLGRLFTLLPVGSVAYRVHLLSALFGAAACGMLWMCARTLVEGRAPAYVAALGLGLMPVFWSQSVIAEVYTLNAFFFVLLIWLGLRASAGLLYWIALVFGLSLSNHWPLMGLVFPAFLILLWPLRAEVVKRLGALSWLVILGLLPYAWMIYRSWRALPISFYGPLETLPEIWFFLSRAGYAGIDESPTGGWLDRIRFLQFLGGEMFVQLAVAGTLLAAAGFAAQWRSLGRRVSAFLTVAFLMPSVVLIFLLRFDYDYLSRHVFHVYPLPSYAVAALWMALGFDWLSRRLALRAAQRIAVACVVLALIGALGARTNLDPNQAWAERYARMVLKTLPRDAVVFPQGDADLPPIAYLHFVENERPDVTLYQANGLILGNRLFHLLRVSDAEAQARLKAFIATERAPLVSTMVPLEGYALRDRWLHVEVDRAARDPSRLTVEIPEEATVFFEQEVLHDSAPHNAWVAYHRNELRFRYALLLARKLVPGQAADERSRRHLAVLENDRYGALGLAEGMMGNPAGYSPAAVAGLLERVRELMPSDELKMHRAKYFYVRAALRLGLGERAGAMGDLETAISVWPARANPAFKALDNVRAAGGG